MMQRALRPSALVPRGFDVEAPSVTARDGDHRPPYERDKPLSGMRNDFRADPQPISATPCGSAHGGRQVRLMVVARRFRCDAVLCGRRIFTERFDDGVLAPWARRTARLDYIVHHLGACLGRPPGGEFRPPA